MWGTMSSDFRLELSNRCETQLRFRRTSCTPYSACRNDNRKITVYVKMNLMNLIYPAILAISIALLILFTILPRPSWAGGASGPVRGVKAWIIYVLLWFGVLIGFIGIIGIEPDHRPLIVVEGRELSLPRYISYWQIAGWMLMALFIIFVYVPKPKSNKWWWIGYVVLILLMLVCFRQAQIRRHKHRSGFVSEATIRGYQENRAKAMPKYRGNNLIKPPDKYINHKNEFKSWLNTLNEEDRTKLYGNPPPPSTDPPPPESPSTDPPP